MSTGTGDVVNDKWVWPATVAFLGALAAVVTLLLLAPSDNAGVQQAVVTILGMLGSAIGSVLVLARVGTMHRDVTEVKEQVNGRMSQLIQKKTMEGEQ